MANRPIFPDTIKNAPLDIENADGTTIQDLVIAGVTGSRIDSISVSSSDTAAVDLIVYYHDGTTDYPIARVNIPIGAGTDGTTPPVSLLNAVDMPFLGDDLSYYLEALKKIRIAPVVAVTATFKVSLVACHGNY